VQLGELKRGRHLESLAVLEAISSKGLVDVMEGTFDMDGYLTAISQKVLHILTVMNRPLFVFQGICLQGFPNHLLTYCIMTTKENKFNVRVNCTSMNTYGISDIKQWVFMCRHTIGMDVMSAAAYRNISTLPENHFSAHCGTPFQDHDFAPGEVELAVPEYSCIKLRPPEFDTYEVNPEKIYEVATASRPALFDPDNLSIVLDDPITCKKVMADNEVYHNVYTGGLFTDFEIDATCTHDYSDVDVRYNGDHKIYQEILDSAGTRRTFRIGSKCFDTVCEHLTHAFCLLCMYD
jgi:hypothetical protein